MLLKHIFPRFLCVNSKSYVRISNISTKRLTYAEYGDPTKTLKLETVDINPEAGIQNNEVFVRWLAAPINPADINQLQGVYPIKPKLPAIGGNEGCARVEKIGTGVQNLKVGDLVIPAESALGTWCTHNIYSLKDLFKIDSELPILDAATFQVNPPTAYRMLKDFAKMEAGDIVVQNGANSAVGRYVIQISKLLNLRSINVVRDRETIRELKDELSELGAYKVYTEEEFAKASREIKDVKLALNCVGGRSSMLLSRTLGMRGCMVSYGGMSKQPVQVPTGSLIFNDISLRGYWMSTWYRKSENYEERVKMYKVLSDWIKNGQLKRVKINEHKFENFKTAFSMALEQSTNAKQILVF